MLVLTRLVFIQHPIGFFFVSTIYVSARSGESATCFKKCNACSARRENPCWNSSQDEGIWTENIFGVRYSFVSSIAYDHQPIIARVSLTWTRTSVVLLSIFVWAHHSCTQQPLTNFSLHKCCLSWDGFQQHYAILLAKYARLHGGSIDCSGHSLAMTDTLELTTAQVER